MPLAGSPMPQPEQAQGTLPAWDRDSCTQWANRGEPGHVPGGLHGGYQTGRLGPLLSLPAFLRLVQVIRAGVRVNNNGTRGQGRGQGRHFPSPCAWEQAQTATQAALADGCKLIEIEFPPTSLSSVPGVWGAGVSPRLQRGKRWCAELPLLWRAGDGEGANEMTYSLQYLRKFCRSFQDQASSIRIFFPDEKVRAYAARVWREAGMGLAAGGWRRCGARGSSTSNPRAH